MKEFVKDRVTLLLGVALLALVLLEAMLIPHKHPEFPWHHLPGYAALIGLFGCIAVVQLSKWLGKLLLQRPEEEA
jgi:peptidoglycan/LPS O-acetylase OafA/YrhL